MQLMKRVRPLLDCIDTICAIRFWVAGTINSIAMADHWSISFRPLHFITFSVRSLKPTGFSARSCSSKNENEAKTVCRASFDRTKLMVVPIYIGSDPICLWKMDQEHSGLGSKPAIEIQS